MGSIETRDRILDAAETLFAEHGFAATSLRKITAAAEVNLAAVNYHFGSKEALVEAVFARLLSAVNQDRIARLDDVLAEAKGGEPPLEAIVRALVVPTARMTRDPRFGSLRRILMRVHAEPGQQEVLAIFVSQFRGMMERFLPALQRAVPGVPPEEISWRMRFAISAMIHAMGAPEKFHTLWPDSCGPYDPDEMIDRLVDFMVAGIRHTKTRVGKGRAAR